MLVAFLPVTRRLYNARRLFVILSVCLLATFRRNYWTGLGENFTTGVPWTRKNWLNLVVISASGSKIFFRMNFWTLRDRAFFYNLVYISGESERIFTQILSQMYPCVGLYISDSVTAAPFNRTERHKSSVNDVRLYTWLGWVCTQQCRCDWVQVSSSAAETLGLTSSTFSDHLSVT